MANALITPSVIAKEALMQLENNLVMGGLVYRDYSKEFAKVGSSVSIRKPVKFATTSGATLTKQDVTENTISVSMDQRYHVGWQFSTNDLTLTVDEYSDRYIKPAAIALGQQVETSLCGLYSSVWNHVGTPGTVPSTFAHLAAAAQRLDEGAVPQDNRAAVFNPATAWSLATGLSTVYVQDKAKSALETAKLGRYANFDTYMGQTITTHTVGPLGGTPLVNGASQSVTYASLSAGSYTQTLVTDGWTASAASRLKAGDVITIASVFAVNPKTGQSTGVLQRFLITADVSSDGSGNLTATISPPIITSGAYQTVNAAPADNAAITVVTGTASTGYAQNLCFQKNAFALVSAPLEMPDGAAFKARESYKGLSIRVIKDYDVVNDTDIIRLDILYGVKTIYPELAARLTA